MNNNKKILSKVLFSFINWFNFRIINVIKILFKNKKELDKCFVWDVFKMLVITHQCFSDDRNLLIAGAIMFPIK